MLSTLTQALLNHYFKDNDKLLSLLLLVFIFAAFCGDRDIKIHYSIFGTIIKENYFALCHIYYYQKRSF